MFKWVSFSLIGGYFTLIANFINTIHSYAHENLPLIADSIVVVTGQFGRVQAGMKMLKIYPCPLFISGVGAKVKLGDLLALQPDTQSGEALRIILGHKAQNTKENGIEIAQWVRANDVRSMILITHTYHMPRALLYLRKFAPEGLKIFPHAITKPVTTWQFLSEMHKYYYAQFSGHTLF